MNERKTAPKAPAGILRAKPTQTRSKKTFETILDAAVDLLVEKGWEGFNTNLLAERAGFRVSAVYRYFPNKLSIVRTIADIYVVEWNKNVTSFGNALKESDDFGQIWIDYLDRFVELLEQQPGALAVRRAMRANPELHELDQADNAQMADKLAAHIKNEIPGLTDTRTQSVARMLIETAITTIDLANDAPPKMRAQLLEDLKMMHVTFIKTLKQNKETGDDSNA